MRVTAIGRTERRGARLLWGAAFAAAACLQIKWWLVSPIGDWGDEATNLLLAKGLLHGTFAIEEGFGQPSNDPLPGFPALLTVPMRLFGGRWFAVRAFLLVGSWVGIWAVWRLARRALPEPWARCVALLTAFNPALVHRASFAAPDVWFALLPALVLSRLPDRASLQQALALGAAAAGIALIRPQGALFAFALAVALAASGGWRAGAAAGAVSATPLLLWGLRNRFLTGVSSGYASNWLVQIDPIGTLAGELRQAARLIPSFFGSGALPLLPAPLWLKAVAGTFLLALAGLGGVRLLRKDPAPWLWTAIAYSVLLLCAHATWRADDARYVLPLLPYVWILAAAGWREAGGGDRLGASAAGLVVAMSAVLGYGPGVKRPPLWPLPHTFDWIRSNVAERDRVNSIAWHIIALGTGRLGSSPTFEEPFRDSWVAELVSIRSDYVVLVPYALGGFHTDEMDYLLAHLEPWCINSPWLTKVYENADEQTAVYHLDADGSRRFRKAWGDFDVARAAARAGRLQFAKRKLREALDVEPRLALAWAALSELEPSPREAERDLEKAVRADPTSEVFRDDLRKARAANAAAQRS